jgi:hypothetical protein
MVPKVVDGAQEQLHARAQRCQVPGAWRTYLLFEPLLGQQLLTGSMLLLQNGQLCRLSLYLALQCLCCHVRMPLHLLYMPA